MTEPAVSASAVSWTADGPVFVVRMDNPPANQLGQALVDGLAAAVVAFEASPARVLVICSALDRFFTETEVPWTSETVRPSR